ncbi:MAG TPA: DedA family protein [Nitrospiria bacterium]|nr:DedA family protein [Nitrospiria bacterium]
MEHAFLHLLRHYGLWAVLVGTFFEGEGVLVGAGILAAKGLLDPLYVGMTAALGAWTGHLFWFFMGRRFGTRYILPRFGLLREKISRANGIIKRRPGTAIVILQYLYGARVFGAIAFGLTELSFGRFVVYEAVNCAVWAAVVETAGYFLGKAVFRFFHGWGRWIWIALSIAVLVWIYQLLKPRDARAR